jgi:hypothetical protein
VCLKRRGWNPSRPAFLESPATRRQTRAPGLRPDGSRRPTGLWAAPKGPLWPRRLLKSPGVVADRLRPNRWFGAGRKP